MKKLDIILLGRSFLCFTLTLFLSMQGNSSGQYDLQDIYQQVTNDIIQVEELITVREYGLAKLLAKKLIDRVNTIQPQTRAIRRISIPKGILTQKDLLKPFEELSFNQKDAIALSLEEQKMGQYMNLLNLLKRANLLYSKAHYLQFKDELLEMDLTSIKDKLLFSYNIPLYIQGENLDEPFLLFDSDVANPLHQENFNRELVAFLTSIEETGFTTEEKIMLTIEYQKLAMLNKHWSSLNASKMAKSCHISIQRRTRESCTSNPLKMILNALTSSGNGGERSCSSVTSGYNIKVLGSFQNQNTDKIILASDSTTSTNESRAREIGKKLLKSLGVCPEIDEKRTTGFSTTLQGTQTQTDKYRTNHR